MFATLRNTLLTTQRGAMFGMDARVALLVFGAIALIGGYSILSRIGTAHAAKLIRELQALETAFTALQTDLGQPITHSSTLGIDASDTADLFAALRRNPDANVYRQWNGPYLNEDFPTSHARYGTWESYVGSENMLLVGGAVIQSTLCPPSCYIWLSLTDVPEEVFTEVNTAIDGNGDPDFETTPNVEGRVRYNASQNQIYVRVVGWNIRAGRSVK